MTLDVSTDSQRRRLRDVLGAFATGVTVVTARRPEGGPVGLTVNSFTSVSLTPPLVLWCLSKESSVLEAFEQSSHFAVNVLSAQQEALARRFASPIADKFAGIDGLRSGAGEAVLLPDCIAYLECARRYTYDGGDHVILVGEVLAIDSTDEAALLFHRGQFATLPDTRD
ncbi:MAG: flavin reductase family protein [Pseudomonadota bacterium]